MTFWTEMAVGDRRLWLVGGEAGLRAVQFAPRPEEGGARDDAHPLLAEAVRQMRAYFEGRLRVFDLPLELAGTPFQLRVWDHVRRIPYGKVRSYGEVAAAIGTPRAVRAVGGANGRNPVPIVVPCHRVIGSGGRLVGYGGGLEWKRFLLDLEAGRGRRTRTWMQLY